MGKIAKSLLGALTGQTPKISSPAPVSTAPIEEVADEGKKAKTARAALYATEGGVLGSELDPTQVRKRPTLLGN